MKESNYAVYGANFMAEIPHTYANQVQNKVKPALKKKS